MIEHIGSASTMQTKTIQSVKSAESDKMLEVSAKEPAVVQMDESRKYDRFEHNGEVSYAAGSPDDPKAREAFDEKRNATSNSRSFDRVEFSEKYLSDDSSANAVVSVEEASSSQNDSDDTSESVDTDKLYQYTDTELKDFLLDGSITQREYDAEIAKREY